MTTGSGEEAITRRDVLGLTGVVGLAGVAGCSGDESPPEDVTTAGTGTDSGRTDEATTDRSPETETEASGFDVSFAVPDEVPRDEPFELRLEGIPSETVLDVVLEGGDPGSEFSARARIVTGEDPERLDAATVVDGDVPSTLDVPLSMGLLQFADTDYWSYDFRPGETLTYRVEHHREEIAAAEVTRTGVDWRQYADVDHEDLAGRVITPPDGGPAPPVLVLHGSDGRPDYHMAATIAENGYTAYALQYFGRSSADIPRHLTEVPLEYVDRAIEWLLDHGATIGDEVGVVGTSRGGELGLLVGSEFETVGSVVSISGSGVVTAGIENGEYAGTSAWTRDGEPLPHLVEPYEDASTEAIEEAAIPVENIDGPVLFVSGRNDGIWDAKRRQSHAAERLRERDDSKEGSHFIYSGAGHMIRPPYTPVDGTVRGRGEGPMGGSWEGNAFASHEHWPFVLDTLAHISR